MSVDSETGQIFLREDVASLNNTVDELYVVASSGLLQSKAKIFIEVSVKISFKIVTKYLMSIYDILDRRFPRIVSNRKCRFIIQYFCTFVTFRLTFIMSFTVCTLHGFENASSFKQAKAISETSEQQIIFSYF